MSKFPRTLNNDLESRLIEAVKARRPLWDPKTPLHKSVKVLIYLWSEVAREMNMDELTVKRKWKNLRDYFSKQTKEIEESKAKKKRNATEVAILSYRHCVWPLYEKLKFLTENNTIERRRRLKLTDDDFRILEEMNRNKSSKSSKVLETIIYHIPTNESSKLSDGESDDCEIVNEESSTLDSAFPDLNASTFTATMLQYLPPPLQKIKPAPNMRVKSINDKSESQINSIANSQTQPQKTAEANTLQTKQAKPLIVNPIVKLIKLTPEQIAQRQKIYKIINRSHPSQRTQKQVENQTMLPIINPPLPKKETQNYENETVQVIINPSQVNQQTQIEVEIQTTFPIINPELPNEQTQNSEIQTVQVINPSQVNQQTQIQVENQMTLPPVINPSLPIKQTQNFENQTLQVINPSQVNQQTQKQIGNKCFEIINTSQRNPQTQTQFGNQAFQMMSQINQQKQIGNQSFQGITASQPIQMIDSSQFKIYQNPSLTSLLNSNPPPLCKIPPLKRAKQMPTVDAKKNSSAPGPSRIKEKDDADYQFFKSLMPFMKDLPMKNRLKVRNSIQQMILKELEAVEKAKNIQFLSNKKSAYIPEEQIIMAIDDSSCEETEQQPVSVLKDEVIEALEFSDDFKEIKTESE